MMTDPAVWSPRCVLCAQRDKLTRLASGHCCSGCEGWLVRTLADLARLVEQAAICGDRQRGAGTGRPVFGSRPPLDVETIDPDGVLVRITDDPPHPTLLEVCEGWERLVRDAREMAPYGPASASRGGANVPGSTRFLTENVAWMTTDPSFPLDDFAQELRACLRAVRRFDRDNESDASWSITCPSMSDDGEDCGYRLRVTGQDVDDVVTCRRCRAVWPVGWLMRVAATSRAGQMWLDAEAVCHRFGVDRKTLERWVRQGRIARKGNQYDAKPLVEASSSTG